jgi:uncharacterized protein (TIGR00661 family)
MKILYAVQGTGNGHLARATEIVPLLQEMAETHVLVSGVQGDIKLPFTVDYQFYGLSFIFGKKGGVSIPKTIFRMNPIRFLRDLYQLPVEKYDLVISDFEPVSAWACKLRKKTCIGLSHQNAVLHPNAPSPAATDWLGRFILKRYAPANKKYGFHFQTLDKWNFTPVIRQSIRDAVPQMLGHYTVYLPAYSDEEIIAALSPETSGFRSTRWEVFSKHSKTGYEHGNIHFRPVSLVQFTESFITCNGILCSAGFETPAEAIFMGKKLCVVPMKNQYEQACNAAFLEKLGIPVLAGLKNQQGEIEAWLKQTEVLRIDYPDETKDILRRVVFRGD